MVACASKGNIIWQRVEKQFWEKNEVHVLPCWIVKLFLVRHACETDTFFGEPKQYIEVYASKEVPGIFRNMYWSQDGANVNIEMTFCRKLKTGVHDRNVQIYFIFKFAIMYNV